jgi:hypothetical protein
MHKWNTAHFFARVTLDARAGAGASSFSFAAGVFRLRARVAFLVFPPELSLSSSPRVALVLPPSGVFSLSPAAVLSDDAPAAGVLRVAGRVRLAVDGAGVLIPDREGARGLAGTTSSSSSGTGATSAPFPRAARRTRVAPASSSVEAAVEAVSRTGVDRVARRAGAGADEGGAGSVGAVSAERTRRAGALEGAVALAFDGGLAALVAVGFEISSFAESAVVSVAREGGRDASVVPS